MTRRETLAAIREILAAIYEIEAVMRAFGAAHADQVSGPERVQGDPRDLGRSECGCAASTTTIRSSSATGSTSTHIASRT
jgi:hypothetical protein